jgi:hypothetical protein
VNSGSIREWITEDRQQTTDSSGIDLASHYWKTGRKVRWRIGFVVCNAGVTDAGLIILSSLCSEANVRAHGLFMKVEMIGDMLSSESHAFFCIQDVPLNAGLACGVCIHSL